MKVAVLVAVLLAPLGCSPKVPVLPGLISEVAIFEGWYTVNGGARIPFSGGREDGQSICKILLAGTACDNKKWQFKGVINLTFAGPKTQIVELTSPEPVVRIDEQCYAIRMDDLMAILERLAKSGK